MKLKHGSYILKEKSPIFKDGGSKLNWVALNCSWGRGVMTVIATINTSYIAKYSYLAGVSYSVTSSIITLTSLTTAILFFILYRERLFLRHLIGMLCLICCVVFISVSK